MGKEPSSAAGYRKRADAIGKGLKSRSKQDQRSLRKRRKALNDMADNEDWLGGKPRLKAKD